jgi:nucleolar GTP-binding protein
VFELPSILTAQALLDKAFGRAAKATAKGPDRATRVRNLAVARVRVAGETISGTLRGYVAGFPSIDRLPPFYRELVDVLLDRGKLKKHLAAAGWAADKARDITREYRRRIGRGSGTAIGDMRREAYGRLSSVVHQIASDLDALIEARRALRRVPEIDPAVPTIVVAGYPNVGKSSFVRAVSTGRPRVAAYPFTTKGVSLGHFERGTTRYQILDTPGILDRPMAERNKMERQAIAALTHIADGVLFLLDPSESCGYPLDAQLRLLEEVQALFPSVPLVVVAAKADLGDAPAAYPRVSVLTGEGVREALDLLLTKVTSRGPEVALRPVAP